MPVGNSSSSFSAFPSPCLPVFSFVPLTHWLRSVASTDWFLCAKKKNDWRRSSPELLNVDERDFSPAAAGGADFILLWNSTEYCVCPGRPWASNVTSRKRWWFEGWRLCFEVSRLKRWRWDKLCPHLQMLFRGFFSWHNHRQGRRKQSPQHTQSSLGEAWYSLFFLLLSFFFFLRSVSLTGKGVPFSRH